MLRSMLLAALFLMSTSSYALGLGEIEIESGLNQRFKAHIPVLVSEKAEPTDLVVSLADRSRFEREGFSRSGDVLELSFTAMRAEDGGMVIKVTSRDRIREPMLNFIIEVLYDGTRTLRSYSALLGDSQM
jgi:pilus assembly protein FimV